MTVETELQKLRDAGFMGFYRVGDLMSVGCADISTKPGVYKVVKPNCKKSFRANTIGTQLAERDKKVTPKFLCDQWVENAAVIYIGKANNLRRRIRQYINFGKQKSENHAGGRLIWWLTDCCDLLICHKTTAKDAAAPLEAELIHKFKSNHKQQLPFANLVKPKLIN